MVRSLRRTARSERGQALVEFAIVFPLLMLLVIGIIEFGRAWNAHQVVTDAAREGARRAVINSSTITQDSVTDRIREYIGLAGFDGGLASITYPDGFKTGSGNPTAVRIEFPYQFVFLRPLIDAALGTSNGVVTLATEARMRNE